MAIRTRRLLGMDDELDDIYRSGTESARAQLAGVDAPADMEFTLEETEQPSEMTFSLDEVDPDSARSSLGTVDPWAGEQRPASTPVRIPGSLPNAGFQQSGAFSRRGLPTMTGTPLAPVPERPIVDDGIDEPTRYAAQQTVGELPAVRPTTLRGARPGTPLLGVDTAYQERQRQQEPDGLDGIDRPASQKTRDNPYQLTKDERARLARAQRRDRNINIARTVFGGLSGLAQLGTAAAGNTGVALGIGQAMSGYEPMQDAVYQRVAGAIDQDRGQRVQAYEYDQQQAQQAAEAERQRAQAERQAALDASQLELRAAQSQREQLAARQMMSEWDQLQGNRQAGIAWLRSLAQQYSGSGAPIVAEVLAGTEPGGVLQSASLDQLNRYAQQLTSMATTGQIAGRAGVGQRPGGAPAYRALVGSPEAESLARFGELSAAERVIVQEGIDAGRDDTTILAQLENFRGGTDSIRDAMLSRASLAREQRSAGGFVPSPDIDTSARGPWVETRRELGAAAARLQSANRMARLLQSMTERYGQAAVRGALLGDSQMVQAIGGDLTRLQAAIGAMRMAYRNQVTGAAASVQEDAAISAALNVGNLASNPLDTANVVRDHARRVMDEATDTIRSTYGDRYVSEWQRMMREQSRPRRGE